VTKFKNLNIEYDDPHNCLLPIGGIMPKNGTWIILRKPFYWVWKARIEKENGDVLEDQFCSFHNAVAFIRKEAQRQLKPRKGEQ
jgi:hypothetical protein